MAVMVDEVGGRCCSGAGGAGSVYSTICSSTDVIDSAASCLIAAAAVVVAFFLAPSAPAIFFFTSSVAKQSHTVSHQSGRCLTPTCYLKKWLVQKAPKKQKTTATAAAAIKNKQFIKNNIGPFGANKTAPQAQFLAPEGGQKGFFNNCNIFSNSRSWLSMRRSASWYQYLLLQ